MNLRRLFLSFILLLGCSAAAFSQRVVSGIITDSANHAPLQSASVTVKGTKTGSLTAADGRFSFKVPADATTLVITSVGYGQKEVPISSESMNISLGQVSSALTDVVVIGYGTTKKKDLTGSIATVGQKDFQKGTITTPEQLISGKVPGVQITSNGGQPGSGSVIRIRGVSSLSSSQDPLIVIDGVPLENSNISGSANPLSLINPNDIESFTVLKDASAAAIYGSRASGGVILITTKKGQGGGKVNISFSTVNSEAVKTNTVDVLSAGQFTNLVNQMGTESQKALLGSSNTNWQDEIYHAAFSTDNNISVSGGIKKLPYRLSLGYLDQDGILRTDNLKRTSGALSLTPSLFTDHLKISLNVKGTIEKFFFANQGAIGSAVFFDPTQPVYDANSKYGGYFEWLDANGNPNFLAPKNPVGILMQNDNTSNVKRSIGNIVFDYKFHFLPDLHANLNLGYDVSHGQGSQTIPETAASVAVQGGFYHAYEQKRRDKTLEFYLNYAKDLTSIKSRIDATAGYGYYDFWHAAPAVYDQNLKGDTLKITPADSSQNTLISYYARVNYSYNNFILLTATVRRDGSSRFAPDTRWGTFPSAALAFNLIKNASMALNNLKLRLGYGETGQRDIGLDYPYIPRYTLSNPQAQYQFGDQFYYTYRPEAFNENLKWETTTTYNGGLDFGFFKGRLNASVDVYKKKTKDLLLFSPLPAGSNLSNQFFLNVGNMENKGVEVNISGTPVKSANFTWTASFNFTYNENKITNLTQAPDPTNKGIDVGGIAGGVGNYIQKYAVGATANSFYVYKQVYDSAGHPIEGLYGDLNRDGQINTDDKYLYKSPYPKFFFGFNSEFDYKQFSLTFVLRANLQNYMYNNVASNSGYYTNIFSSNPFLNNGSADVLVTNFQRPQYWSDYYIQNASFLRMDNLNLGYNFGRVINKTTNLRVGFTIQNVFVITKYKGLDPEIFNGIDNNFYPKPRVYSLGVNLDF
jgi:iron complex outermembrane receptor protein